MAASAQKISQDVIDEVNRQYEERQAAKVTDEVRESVEAQYQLRNGDYPENTLPGAVQAAGGVVENLAQMVSGFASAIPGAAAGITAAFEGSSIYSPRVDINKYPDAFAEQAEKTTYEPRTKKGKRYSEALADTYNEYINEKWGNEYLGGLVDSGQITPEEAAYYKTSADALVMGLFMKAGGYAKAAGAKAADFANYRSGRIVDIDATTAVTRVDPLTGEYVPAGVRGGPSGSRGSTFEGEIDIKALEGPQGKLPAPQGKLPAPPKKALTLKELDIKIEDIPVQVAIRGALERGVNPNEIARAVDTESVEVAVENIQKLYHGTPHKFDKFSLDAIGTGEGAQAYGHGLYFAEDAGVAGSYKDVLNSGKRIRVDGLSDAENETLQFYATYAQDRTLGSRAPKKDLLEFIDSEIAPLQKNIDGWQARLDEVRGDEWQEFLITGNKDHAIDRLRILKDIREKLPNIPEQSIDMSTGGHLYEVDIPDEVTAKMLDWDAPLSEQPELMNIARRVYDEDDARIGSFTGQDLYRDLSSEMLSDEAASAALAKEGIPGIRFYDGASRGKGEGTRNIVVFDENVITKVSRDGETTYEAPQDPMRDIFRNRQAGAVDMDVFAEGVTRMLRPGVIGAKVGADLAHSLARQVAFKHVTDIRKINSPTAKMLADRIMPLEDSKIPLGAGFHERVSLSEGQYQTRIENVLEPLRTHTLNKNSAKTLRVVALSKRVNDAIFRGLDSGKVREDLVPAVQALRAILNDIYRYQKEAGVDVGYLDNHMPHMWNGPKIARAEFGRKNGGPFTKYLMEEEGLSFDVAQEVIATLTHEEGFMDFVDDAGGRLQRGQEFSEWAGRVHQVGGGAARPGVIKSRTLKGDFDAAKEWLVTDVESVLTNYVNRAVAHAEYVRIAGPGEKNLNKLVRQIIEEQQFAGNKGGKLRVSSPHTTAQEIYDVFDAMQGRFNQIKNQSVRRTSRAIAGYQVIQKLSLVALAQFPETMMPAAKYRVATATKALPGIPIPLKSYAVGMVDSLANALSTLSTAVTGKRVIPKTDIREHLERIGIITPSALQSSATRMAGPVGVITNRAIRAFGMEAITNLQRSITYDTINSMIRENARYLAKGLAQGTREKMYRQELIELGISPEDAISWYRDGMPKDHPISKQFDIAMVRGGDTTIIMPKAANAPRLYNDPRFQLPLIFTRFFTVFGNTVLKGLGKKLISGDVTNVRKLGSISALIAAVGIAYYTQFLRESITGYEYREEDDPMRIVDAVDRSGLTAMFTRLYPLFSAYKYGAGSKVIAGTLGGPFASDVAGFIEAANGTNEQRARFLARQTPIMTVTPASEDIMYEFYLEMIDSLPEGR